MTDTILRGLHIDGVAHGGFGVARADGKVIFVRGVIPGETVDVRVTRERKTMSYAIVDDVAEASPDRVVPAWPEGVAGVTGAADLSHMTLDAQIRWKNDVLADAIRRVGGPRFARHMSERELPTVERLDDGDGWHTRTRFDVTVREGSMAMYREGTHDLVDIEQMPMAVESIAAGPGAETLRLLEGKKLHIVAPTGDDPLLTDGRSTWDFSGMLRSERTVERVDMTASPAGEKATHAVPALPDTLEYGLTSQSFWQSHRHAPVTLISAIVEGAKVFPGDTIYELFSGSGLFTIPLAYATGTHGQVISYEASRRAVEDAKENTRAFSQVSARRGRVTGALVEKGADIIVADPPRTGLGVDLAWDLGRSSARRIVLVSCDPASMARDAAALVESGMEVVSMRAFDLFPHTHHFEMVTVFNRAD